MTRTWQQERADVVAWLESRAYYAGCAGTKSEALTLRRMVWTITDGKHVRRKPRPKRRKR